MVVLAWEIPMEQVRFHLDRNKLLKVIGNGDEVSSEIKELTLDRSVGNAFLICTDGFGE
jgi:serine/threonine protein phosphatase PrpC